MPRNGRATREKILDAAQALILERGYAGVSIDGLIAHVGITKGAFFYHFKSKNELAQALIARFTEMDRTVMRDATARAERLSRDPLQQLLIFVGLFEEMFEGLSEPYPGCLFASYVYELQQFDSGTQQIVFDSFIHWREHLTTWFDKIVEVHSPKLPIDTASLADAFTVVLEGAFITAKATNDADVIPQQLRHFRNYLELLFSDT
jgi:TetR/AcrR family transcriptional repressor of nem operon